MGFASTVHRAVAPKCYQNKSGMSGYFSDNNDHWIWKNLDAQLLHPATAQATMSLEGSVGLNRTSNTKLAALKRPRHPIIAHNLCYVD